MNDSLLVPNGGVEPAHALMPEDLLADYNEAASIASYSPRSAAALLRLCLQKLCIELGELGKNINDDIGSLVRKGLPAELQRAMDVLRVVGNEQVHPGVLDVRDDPQIVNGLFRLMNILVERLIAQPMLIEQLYKGLPQTKIGQIERRSMRAGDTDA